MIFVFSNAAYEGAGSWRHEIPRHSGDCANEIYTVREPCKVMNEYVWNLKLLFRNTSIMDSFISWIFLCCQGQNGWWSWRIDRLKRPGDVHHVETRRRGSQPDIMIKLAYKRYMCVHVVGRLVTCTWSANWFHMHADRFSWNRFGCEPWLLEAQGLSGIFKWIQYRVPGEGSNEERSGFILKIEELLED